MEISKTVIFFCLILFSAVVGTMIYFIVATVNYNHPKQPGGGSDGGGGQDNPNPGMCVSNGWYYGTATMIDDKIPGDGTKSDCEKSCLNDSDCMAYMMYTISNQNGNRTSFKNFCRRYNKNIDSSEIMLELPTKLPDGTLLADNIDGPKVVNVYTKPKKNK